MLHELSCLFKLDESICQLRSILFNLLLYIVVHFFMKNTHLPCVNSVDSDRTPRSASVVFVKHYRRRTRRTIRVSTRHKWVKLKVAYLI